MHQSQEFYSRDDEIDLFQLFESLFHQKLLIIGMTVLTGGAATVVSFMLPKTYSSEAIINQAPMAQFVNMNSVNSLIEVPTGIQKIITNDRQPYGQMADVVTPTGIQKTITNDRIYEDFRLQVTSYDTYRYAFDHSLLAKDALKNTDKPEVALTKAYEKFRQNLSIHFDKSRENKTKRITIRYESEHPEETTRIINDVVLPYAAQQVIAGIAADRKALIEQEKKYLEQIIRNLESSFLAENHIKQLKLEEAITQARAANIENLMISENYPTTGGDAQFLYGTRLLTARQAVVKDRVSQYRYFSRPEPEDNEKPYLSIVQNQIQQLNQLSNIDTNFSDIQPVIFEKKAEIPVLPDKPKKSLIVALGLIAGGMLGIFIALIRIAIQSRQEKERELYRLTNET